MSKQEKLRQLKKLLRAIPAKERSAIVKRAQLRSVDRNYLKNESHPIGNIMLPKMETKNSIGTNPRPTDCDTQHVVNTKKIRVLNKNKDGTMFPISNFPAVQNPSTGLPDDPIVIEIFTLTRQNADLRRDLRAAQKKITRALESLHNLRRYFRLGLFENQWETYDELRRRMGQLDSVLQFLEDPLGGIDTEESPIPNRWRKDKP